MIVTTSRKPGRKTRTFVRLLSSYMNWHYIPRGKKSLEDFFSSFPDLVIIEEIKGNPSILKVFKNSKEIFRIRFNLVRTVKLKMDNSPVFFSGKLEFNPSILGAVPSNIAGEKIKRKLKIRKELVKEVIVGKKRGRIFLDFRYRGKTMMFIYLNRKGYEP
jgi:U3 small nucleolar ribonucleoprotein protein IMP4